MHKPIDLFANPSLKRAGNNHDDDDEGDHQGQADHYP
jgi:hypothetical protein